MRQPHTFLLTILLEDLTSTILRGRVRSIGADSEQLFANVQELASILLAEIKSQEHHSDVHSAQSSSIQVEGN